YVSILSVMLCFAPFAVAQDTFTLTAANPNGFYYGNNPAVYVSPYSATITGASPYSGYVVCDDYSDDVTVGESWSADSATIGSGGVTNGLFESQNYSYTLNDTSGPQTF